MQRFLKLNRWGQENATVTTDVEDAINQTRGSGRSLDGDARRQMESAFGADFGAVRVHTDTGADGLNRALSAKAFTTGSDIYFRQGEYNPGSSGGRELLAHELTHVVQQNPDRIQPKSDDEFSSKGCARGSGPSGAQMKLIASEPGDQYERGADQIAKEVTYSVRGHLAATTKPAVIQRLDEEDYEGLSPVQAVGKALGDDEASDALELMRRLGSANDAD